MKLKRLRFPLWGILLGLLFLQSCRTQDEIEQMNAQNEKVKQRFRIFLSKDNKPVNYANGFAVLMKKYDSVKKTNLTGLVNSSNVLVTKNAGKTYAMQQNQEAYIDFSIRSQLITETNGDKWVIFPKVYQTKVVGLVLAVLTDEGTYVAYRNINNENDFYKKNAPLFQSKVTEKLNRFAFRKGETMATNICGQIGATPDCTIEEVIIYVGSGGSTGGPGGIGIGGGGSNTGGGTCLDHRVECANDDTGGGSGGNETTDPCAKAKAGVQKANTLLSDARVKEAFTEALKNFAKDATNSEMGISIGINGTDIQPSAPIIKEGNVGEIPPPPSGYSPYADGHNHVSSTPPSAGDVWGMLEQAANNPSFETRYAFGKDGTIYALTVNDRQAIATFLQSYPKSQYIGANGDWANKSTNFLYSTLDEMRSDLMIEATDQGYNQALASAWAYLMESFNMGVSISKSNGTALKTLTAKRNSQTQEATSSPCN